MNILLLINAIFKNRIREVINQVVLELLHVIHTYYIDKNPVLYIL